MTESKNQRGIIPLRLSGFLAMRQEKKTCLLSACIEFVVLLLSLFHDLSETLSVKWHTELQTLEIWDYWGSSLCGRTCEIEKRGKQNVLV